MDKNLLLLCETDKSSQLLKAVALLERNYSQADPNNLNLISEIKKAIADKVISYEELDLPEEVFTMMISDAKQLALNLCSVFIVDGNNCPVDLFTQYNKDDSLLSENEKLFAKQAIEQGLINFKDIRDSCHEYDFDVRAKKALNSYNKTLYQELPEEKDIQKTGFACFLTFPKSSENKKVPK